MVTDEQFSNASFDQHSMDELLSGFNSDGHTDHLSVNETMSDIGRVVSQGEAGMDFTTNMDAPLDGVWTKRPAGRAPVDDISMSRFAESYWKPQHDSDDLQSMEFSTHSADAKGAQTHGTGRGEEETVSDSFLDQANGHSRAHLGSFHSDAGNSHVVRELPRRPESYHPQVNDGSMFDDTGTSRAMPTFSSQRVPLERRDTRGRFARLAARYFQPTSDTEAVHNQHDAASSDGMSDIPGVPDTPDIHTMFASDQMSMTSGSPSPPPSARYPPVASASIVERTHTALQTRFKSMDEPASGYGQQAVLARAQSQPVMDGMAYGRRTEPRAELPSVNSYQHMAEPSRDELPTMSSYQRIAPNGAELPTISSYQHMEAPNGVDQSTVNSYQHMAPNGVDQSTVNSYQHMAFSMDTQSHESLDHPNLGSQGTHSPGSSFTSREPRTYAGASSATPFDPSRDHTFEHMERFEPITNADTAFGDYSSNATSSIPDMDAILRDHEQVFNDLFPSDDEQGDYDLPPHTISNEFDVHKPPASLFASSASIVAEIGRRSNPKHGQRNRVVSSWDAHDVTPDAMRRQELQYGPGVHNPIEMLDKSNSLGIDEGSDVSGLLPESERSSFAAVRTQPMTPRSTHMHFTEPPPPTTPTTIVSRDTRHRPSSRVLHNVPPFMGSPRQPDRLGSQLNHSFSRRPAGPRGMDPAASRRPPKLDIQRASPDQRNIRAAADFAASALDNSDSSSHGLGSLFHDSLPTLDMSSRSRMNRLGNLLPRNSPSSQNRNVSMGHDGYEPFQDPTVDVSQLAKYGTVGMRHEWALSNQHKGVSADRVDSSVRKLPVVADHEIRSSPSMVYESDEMVPTVRYDSTPQVSHRSTPIGHVAQTSGNEGPTLADIYELLKRTASSIVPEKSHDAQEPSPEDPMDPVSLHPDVRPSAPTPRRSRQFPSVRHMHAHDDMSMRARAGSVHSRFQEFLRQAPDSPNMDYEHEMRAEGASVADRMSQLALQSSPPQEVVRNDIGDVNDAVGTLGQAVREHAHMDNVPVALAEKLLELATALASARTTKTAATDTAKDQATPTDSAESQDTNGVELRQLHRDIMAKFDECRTEVDMLRAEVRQGSAASTHARTSSVVPHDSVSAVAAANATRTFQGTPPRAQSRMMTPSPRPQSDVRPMYTVPTTAKNRQRHMVQWLSRQDRDAMSHTSDRRNSHSLNHANGHSPSPHAKHTYRTTVQDASDDDYAYDEGALSDASTTVPGSPVAPRLAMRSPLAAIKSSRQPNQRTPRGKPSQWTGNEGLLETRHTLDIIRKKRKQAKHEDDSFGDFVYDARMTRELAHTLAELQRAHERHFHARTAPCPVCASLKAQNQDPYLFGKHAAAYKSLSTRELQKLLNAYVTAMETDNADEALESTRMPNMGRHVFTPTRRKGKAPREHVEHNEGPRMVLELLHEELAALSRRYHRMVAEYHALDPALPGDQRARRRMARELKDLVDLLDVKGEQIAVLAGLHPTTHVPVVRPPSARNSGCIERAYQSAKALQNALGDLY
ncbi:hypothetical protein GGH12_001770 [Coemansia sp. RSA 1822]|nr:hypothetical protein LPJ76_003560 [Coemansia sp. RSA 638]KAJ2564802.1 hypothetical protein GGH12_001770 [Coemansia sp. RSA 1822]